MRTFWALFLMVLGSVGTVVAAALLMGALLTHQLHMDGGHCVHSLGGTPSGGPRFSELGIHLAPIALGATISGCLLVISIGLSRLMGREKSLRRLGSTFSLALAVPAVIFAWNATVGIERWENAAGLNTRTREQQQRAEDPSPAMLAAIEANLAIASQNRELYRSRYHASLLAAGVFIAVGGVLRLRKGA